MRIAMGSDHAGFPLKEAVKVFLIEEHRDIVDLGTYSIDPVDYSDYAEAIGRALRENRAERGILLCGSGVGASMAANRIPGIRAGLCHDTYSAHQGVEHDDMNVLVLGGRIVGVELARELIGAFLNAHFSGDTRHRRRLAKMTALENPLRALQVFGQSVWLDYIRRSLITSGELQRLIDEDGVWGVTSNPAIFEKAVIGSSDYRKTLERPEFRIVDAKTAYERLAVQDIQDAADALRPVYDETDRRDGYVSLEVSPLLAYDTAATLDEARRLWRIVARDNLMIKVPATSQGIPAVHELIAEGINVNVTLLFAQEAYERVVEAYIAGLERHAARGGDLKQVASVASFFISRIDTAIDALITARLKAGSNDSSVLRGLIGKVAIANAKLAYQRYQELFSGRRWQALASQGAQTQRLLWASTGTKNPAYRDVIYIEELIGPDTVNTMPPATFDAFRDHGRPRASLMEDPESASDTMATLAEVGISMKDVTDQLLVEGVQLFSDSFGKLLKAVEKQTGQAEAGRLNRLTYTLPEPLAIAVRKSLLEWRDHGKLRKLWGGDASLWSGRDEAQWLGWLGITNDQLAQIERLNAIREAARTAGFSHVLLLGMGGSSLGPEVIKTSFGTMSGFPELYVLDSTDPAHVQAFENKVDLRNTLFIVSSKSGSTLEPNVFKQYFFDRITTRRPEGSRPSLPRHHRSGLEIAAGCRTRRLPAHLSRLAQHRGALLGSLRFRAGPGGHYGRGCCGVPGTDRANGVCLHAVRFCCRKPRRHARHGPRRGSAGIRPRQNDNRGITADLESRRLVGAAGGGVHGKGRQGVDSNRSRTARQARCLWPRPPACLSEIVVSARRGGGRSRGRTGTGRSPRDSHCDRRPVRSRGRVFPLGIRHCSRWFDSRHPSIRSA